MSKSLHTLLVLALPASGKSEARKRMEELADPERFHLSNDTVQLDDYPYVRLMRHIDDILVEIGLEPIFFQAHDQPFIDPRSWEALIHLINEDYLDLLNGMRLNFEDVGHTPASYMLSRLGKACELAGMPNFYSRRGEGTLRALIEALEEECAVMVREQQVLFDQDLEGKTIVIEFARGGPEGASLPLDPPRGNQHALSILSDEILRNASILWIRVTPEESRHKNVARARPGEDGTMHHCVPEVVMRGEYGTCDMQWLLEHSAGGPNTVTVEAHGHTYFLPVGTFDNIPDKTTCMHQDPENRNPKEVAALDAELEKAMRTTWTTKARLEESGRHDD